MSEQQEQRSPEKILGPFTFDMYVHVQNADGTNRGKVTVGISPGKVPTRDQIIKAIGDALKALPEDYGLMESDNFVTLLMEERFGTHEQWASPPSMRYDIDALTKQALEASDNVE